MSYDFRKQAGERNFLDNFSADAEKLYDKLHADTQKAGKKHLKVVSDLLENFGLSLDLKKSWVDRYKVGSDSWGYSGAMVVKGDLPKEGIEGALWDVTLGLKFHNIYKSGDVWIAEFNVGG